MMSSNEKLYKRFESIKDEINLYIEENLREDTGTDKVVGGILGVAVGAVVGGVSIKTLTKDIEHKATQKTKTWGGKETLSTSMGDDEVLNKILEQRAEPFSVMLLRMITEKGLKDSEVYKQANIDRRLFSKIRGDENYVPSKKTVISFCLALHLEINEAIELLKSAGYALSNASKFDLIIMYLIEKREYNVTFANIVLDEYGEGVLSK